MIELLLLSYAGIILHYLLKLKEASEKSQLESLFTRPALLRELISTVTSIVAASIIVYVREDIASIFVVTPVGAVIAGYAGQSILNKILGAKLPAQVVQQVEKTDFASPIVGDGGRPKQGPK